MQTLTSPIGPSDPTAAVPRWAMLKREILTKDNASPAADPKTTAASCTSCGIHFSISISIAAPPEASSFYYDLVAGESSTPLSSDVESRDLLLVIIAAHDDCVLIEMTCRRSGFGFEYFLYEAARGAELAPTLSLLPGCYISKQSRNLSLFHNTGILRRGEGEVLVSKLEVGYDLLYSSAELCVLRTGHDWVFKQMTIVHHERKGKMPRGTEIDATVPVGSRFMCWVDYLGGFIFCDLSEENPKLRYVPLPVSSPSYISSDRPDMQHCRNLAAAGPGAVRFVNVAPHCCCGGPGKTTCERSNFSFNVTTWTLTLRTKKTMAWVKDGVLDCNELWQLPNYDRLPRVALGHPIVSSDDPDIVCFTVCEKQYLGADEKVWMVMINMRSKALLSVVCRDTEYYNASDIVTAKLRRQ